MTLPLLWLSAAFFCGLVTGDGLGWGWAVWAGIAVASLLAWAVLRFGVAPRLWDSNESWVVRLAKGQPPLGVAPLLLVAAVALGGLRYQVSLPRLDSNHVAWYNGQPVTLRALVVAAPQVNDQSVILTVQARQVAPTASSMLRNVSGLVRVTLRAGQKSAMDIAYGDIVHLNGELASVKQERNPGWEGSLVRQGILSRMDYPTLSVMSVGQGNPFKAALIRVHQNGLAVLERLFPPPESDLLQGILLGDDSGIPVALQEAYKRTGTAHIIAISGFNIAILAGLFSILFTRLLGRWRGLVVAGLAIAFYTLLVGAGASVVRAAIMGILGLFGRQIGRRQDGLNSLAFTAAVMGMWDPQVPWSVSFQLSFMATLGLVLYASPLQERFTRLAGKVLPAGILKKVSGPVGEYILFTLAAQITTLPIMLYHFQQASLIALVANPLVLPVQSLVMVLGGVALLGGWVSLLLGQILAYLAWPFAAYTNRMVEALAALPAPNWQVGSFSLGLVALCYAALFGLPLLKDWRGLLRKVMTPQAVLLASAVLAALVWWAVLTRPDGRLHLSLLSPTAILVRAPGGGAVLVNGGPDSSQLNQAIARRLPAFRHGVDLALVADAEPDSAYSLANTLAALPPRQVLWAVAPDGSTSAADLQQVVSAQGWESVAGLPAQMVSLGGGAGLELVAVGRRSAVILVTWHNFRAVILSGAIDQEPEILNGLPLSGPVDALYLVGFQPGQIAPEILDNFQPRVVIIGEGEPGLAAGYATLLYNTNGWIDVATDGQQMWVEAEKVSGD
jgi:competence protein ComEC